MIVLSLVGTLADRMVTPSTIHPLTLEVNSELRLFYRRHRRPISVAGWAIWMMLGSWCLLVAVVGAVTERHWWVWPALMAPPIAYLFGPPMLRLAGRMTAGGILLSPTTITNTYRGSTTSLRYDQIEAAIDHAGTLRLHAKAGAKVSQQRCCPIWVRRSSPTVMVIDLLGFGPDGESLATEIRRRAALL